MPRTATQQTVDDKLMEELIHRVVADCGAAMSSALVHIGDRLGLYQTLANDGPMTPRELARATNTNERYVREWLVNQAGGGYVSYDKQTSRYYMTPEQAAALADPESPTYLAGGFQTSVALIQATERIATAFRSGSGMLWSEHDPNLFEGTERFFRPGYQAHLVSEWIPALEGVQKKLETGGNVADVGCGHGASTIILAKAYPKSAFVGFDNHPPSIVKATEAAAKAGCGSNIRFEVASATEYRGAGYDLITFFDCYHDLSHPIGAASHAFAALKPEGVLMIVEPMAGDHVEDNINPLGRVFSAASTLCCVPNSLALGGPALGAIASDTEIRDAVTAGGFTRFRRATETPFNRVFEARR